MERATAPASTPQARQPRQEIEQHDAARRPLPRGAEPRTADASARMPRALESAAPSAAGRATVQPARGTGSGRGSGDELASAMRAGPGTIATTVRSPPERRTARP